MGIAGCSSHIRSRNRIHRCRHSPGPISQHSERPPPDRIDSAVSKSADPRDGVNGSCCRTPGRPDGFESSTKPSPILAQRSSETVIVHSGALRKSSFGCTINSMGQQFCRRFVVACAEATNAVNQPSVAPRLAALNSASTYGLPTIGRTRTAASILQPTKLNRPSAVVAD
jgi:hypothetical protein